MNILGGILTAFSGVPDWVPCIIVPSGLLVYTVAIVLFGGRKSYPFVSFTIGAAATALVCARGGGAAVLFVALYATCAAFLHLLLRIPRPKIAFGQRANYGVRELEKRLSAEPAITKAPSWGHPLEERERLTAEECGMRLAHAEELLTRLKSFPLAASDRLEADVILRTLEGCRTRRLSEEEMGNLNDSLAAIIKLSAKYKL